MPPLGSPTQGVLISYTAKQLHLTEADALRIAGDEVLEGCYHKLTFQSTAGRAVLYLTPDQRFLSPQFYDTRLDPAAAIKAESSQIQRLLLADPSPARGRTKTTLIADAPSGGECAQCLTG